MPITKERFVEVLTIGQNFYQLFSFLRESIQQSAIKAEHNSTHEEELRSLLSLALATQIKPEDLAIITKELALAKERRHRNNYQKALMERQRRAANKRIVGNTPELNLPQAKMKHEPNPAHYLEMFKDRDRWKERYGDKDWSEVFQDAMDEFQGERLAEVQRSQTHLLKPSKQEVSHNGLEQLQTQYKNDPQGWKDQYGTASPQTIFQIQNDKPGDFQL